MLIVSIIHSDPDSDINYRLSIHGSTELPGKGTSALREEATSATPEDAPDPELWGDAAKARSKQHLKYGPSGMRTCVWSHTSLAVAQRGHCDSKRPRNFRVQTWIPCRGELQLNFTHKPRVPSKTNKPAAWLQHKHWFYGYDFNSACFPIAPIK